MRQTVVPDGARGLASRLPTLLCVVLVHASLIAWLPALAPRAATPPQPIAVRLLEPEPLPEPEPEREPEPPKPVEPTRPPVPLPQAAAAPPRPARSVPRRPAPLPSPAPEAVRSEEPVPVPEPRPEVAAPAAPEPPAVAVVEGAGPAVALAPTAPARDPAPSRAPVEAPAAVTPARHDADYLRNPAPAYPAVSRRLRETGRVLLRVTVSAEGDARSVEIEQGSGHARLDEAARRAVAGWRFVPARRGDVPVVASVLVPIVFRLDE